MSQKKSNTAKADRRTSAKITVTRKDALMLFNAINREGISDKARIDILGYIDEVIDDAPSQDPAHNKSLFLRLFSEGWQESSRHARRNMGEIIQRLRAGQTIEEIHNAFEQERAAWRRKKEEEERSKPEPKNWLSQEWRWWKIRQLERAFNGNDREAYQAAWDEFKALLHELSKDGNFYHTYFARNLLPHLIEARQVIAGLIGQPKGARRKPEYLKTKKGGKR